MSIVSLTVNDGISKEFEKLIKKTRNMKPAMREIEMLIMRPLKSKAWSKSGLDSQSGELKGSVEAWYGKKSVGVAVHAPKHRSLVLPKAVIHSGGAKGKKYIKRRKYKVVNRKRVKIHSDTHRTVREHRRGGKKIDSYERRNTGSPWGDIKPRPFIPARLGAGDVEQVKKIIERYLHV